MAAARTAAAAAKDIYEVILAFQTDPPTLLKDTAGQVGPRKYNYVDLNQVVERVLHERLNKAGCIVIQPMDGTDLLTIIRHVPSGTEVSSRAFCPDGLNPQDLGKAVTYMRRYSLVSLLCLVGEEDDDGAGFQPKRRQAVAPEGAGVPAGTVLPPPTGSTPVEL